MHCAARFVTGNCPLWSTSSSGLVSSLGWCTLEQRRLLNMALLFFKFHNNLVGSQILPEFAANQRCNRRHGLTYRQVQTNLLCYSDTGRKSETDEDLYDEGDNESDEDNDNDDDDVSDEDNDDEINVCSEEAQISDILCTTKSGRTCRTWKARYMYY